MNPHQVGDIGVEKSQESSIVSQVVPQSHQLNTSAISIEEIVVSKADVQLNRISDIYGKVETIEDMQFSHLAQGYVSSFRSEEGAMEKMCQMLKYLRSEDLCPSNGIINWKKILQNQISRP